MLVFWWHYPQYVFNVQGRGKIPIGTVYPVWTEIGAIGAVFVGILFFNEPATFWRVFFITTLIILIIGLKVLA